MTQPRWPVVLFDLDGTLVNTIPLILASYVHAIKEVLGRDIAPEEGVAWIGRPLIEVLREYDPEHAEEILDVYTTWNLSNLDRLVEQYEGMDVLLADLRQAEVRIGIATSKRRHSAELTLASSHMSDAIELVATMAETERHKPLPDPLLYACRALGGEPSECVYIGDAVVDILAARAAGMDAVAVTWGAGTAEDLAAAEPSFLVETVTDLHALLLG